MDRILAQHQGYFAHLASNAGISSGQILTATLRVPVDQLDAALAELKRLGRVMEESQTGEEVSQQHVDLLARLKNARNTEARLNAVLQQHTGKVSDILEVEKESARVRGEIERMEAERQNLEKRVEFATVKLSLTEEYKEQLHLTPPSTSTQMHNALVAGYRDAVEAALDVVLFALHYGPTLLLWAALLFFPARFAWRWFRRSATTSAHA